MSWRSRHVLDCSIDYLHIILWLIDRLIYTLYFDWVIYTLYLIEWFTHCTCLFNCKQYCITIISKTKVKQTVLKSQHLFCTLIRYHLHLLITFQIIILKKYSKVRNITLLYSPSLKKILIILLYTLMSATNFEMFPYPESTHKSYQLLNSETLPDPRTHTTSNNTGPDRMLTMPKACTRTYNNQHYYCTFTEARGQTSQIYPSVHVYISSVKKTMWG